MKRILTFCFLVLLMTVTELNSVANAGLSTVAGGPIAPASTLGPYTMTPFEDDLRPTYMQYNYVESPLAGEVYFSSLLEHLEVPSLWMTWSHGYSGDVYMVDNSYYVSLEMPEGTSAFYFYAQPEFLEIHTITAEAFDGLVTIEQISQEVNGNSGACYFGFYGTNGSVIKRINIYSDSGFAIGEFGISTIPAPGALCLCNIGLYFLMKYKKLRIL